MPPKRHKPIFNPIQQQQYKPIKKQYEKEANEILKVAEKNPITFSTITFSTIALIFFAMSIFCMVGYVYVWIASFSGTHNTDGTVTIIVPESRYVVIQVYLVMGLVLTVLSVSVQMYHSKN